MYGRRNLHYSHRINAFFALLLQYFYNQHKSTEASFMLTSQQGEQKFQKSNK